MAGTQSRRGLVLGAGGVLGAAWTVGALWALEESQGWDPREADLLMGTSAGAVIAALLAGGIRTSTLVNHQRGFLGHDDPVIDYDYDTALGGALPRRPRARLGSPSMLRNSIRRIRDNPMPLLYSLLPEGRGTLESLGELIDAVYTHADWPPHLRIPVVDYDTGERVVLGSPGAPPATLREAVMASCAAPCWYAPVRIGGRRYIDGGVYSAASLDLLVGRAIVDADFDEITMLAPMASFRYDRPRSPVRWVERGWRRFVTARLLREANVVERSGVPLKLLAPGPQDLTAIGANLMDPSRRITVLETALRTSAETLHGTVPDRAGGRARTVPQHWAGETGVV